MEIPKTTKLERLDMALKATFKLIKKKLKIKSTNNTDISKTFTDITPQTIYIPSFIKYASYLTFLRIDVYNKYPLYVGKVEEWCDTDEADSFVSWLSDDYLYVIDVHKFIINIEKDQAINDLHTEVMSMSPKFQELNIIPITA